MTCVGALGAYAPDDFWISDETNPVHATVWFISDFTYSSILKVSW